MVQEGTSGQGWDFFISYTHVDRAWAEWIAWQLEEDGYVVLIQAWDMVPGSNWPHRMQDGVRSAARTVAVLSVAYAGSVFAEAEWEAAWREDPVGQQRKLLVFRIEHCRPPGLMAGVVTVDLFGMGRDAASARIRTAARDAVVGRAKPAVEPSYPPEHQAERVEPRFPGVPPKVQSETLRNPDSTCHQRYDTHKNTPFYIAVLGRADISLNGAQQSLTPLTLKLFLRLIAAEGQAIPAKQIYRDVWEIPLTDRVEQQARGTLQKRVAKLRSFLDPQKTLQSLRAERLLVAGKPESCYRLMLDRSQVDYLQFEDLVKQAGGTAPALATALLAQALGLWRGEPLADVANLQFSGALAQRLMLKCQTAVKDLARMHLELGNPEAALPVAERLAEILPADGNISETLRSLRARVRAYRSLQTALLWELSPARWERFAAVLESLAVYLAQGDLDAFDVAASQLELAGPVRATRIGAAHLAPPPASARDRISQLIHSLSGQSEDTTWPES